MSSRAGCRVVDDEYRAPHLFGVLLRENRVYVSIRSQGLIRVSISVFNEELNLIMLINTLKKMLKKSSL
jgi:hypothetical protein